MGIQEKVIQRIFTFEQTAAADLECHRDASPRGGIESSTEKREIGGRVTGCGSKKGRAGKNSNAIYEYLSLPVVDVGRVSRRPTAKVEPDGIGFPRQNGNCLRECDRLLKCWKSSAANCRVSRIVSRAHMNCTEKRG